ncbi:hypothetical protein JCM10213_008347 [Rhodosporidiobolus nylandii]
MQPPAEADLLLAYLAALQQQKGDEKLRAVVEGIFEELVDKMVDDLAIYDCLAASRGTNCLPDYYAALDMWVSRAGQEKCRSVEFSSGVPRRMGRKQSWLVECKVADGRLGVFTAAGLKGSIEEAKVEAAKQACERVVFA